MLLAGGANIELVPGGFRQFAPILRRYDPRVMTVLAAPPDGRHGQPVAPPRRHLRGAAAGRARTPTGSWSSRSTPTCPGPARSDPTTPTPSRSTSSTSSSRPTAPRSPSPRPQPDEIDEAIAEAGPLLRRPTAPPCRSASAPSPTWWPPSWPRAPAAATASTRRCSPTGSCASTRPARSPTTPSACSTACPITTFALGSSELYAWLDGNDDVAFVPVQVVNDPTVIAQNHAFVSINGALSVDLYGQVVADNIDGSPDLRGGRATRTSWPAPRCGSTTTR